MPSPRERFLTAFQTALSETYDEGCSPSVSDQTLNGLHTFLYTEGDLRNVESFGVLKFVVGDEVVDLTYKISTTQQDGEDYPYARNAVVAYGAVITAVQLGRNFAEECISDFVAIERGSNVITNCTAYLAKVCKRLLADYSAAVLDAAGINLRNFEVEDLNFDIDLDLDL
jgi:hypothetical protein